MHLLVAQPGALEGGDAVDLGQTPADIVILSAADSELACLAAAFDHESAAANGDFPTLRLANVMALGHPLSVDLYVDSVIRHARLVIVRLLGGAGYWRYGLEQVEDACRAHGVLLAALPGDDQPDPDLVARSTLPAEAVERLWRYLGHGGVDNAGELLRHAAGLIGGTTTGRDPRPLPRAGLVWPGERHPDLACVRRHWGGEAPVAAIVFYRALVQAGDLAPVEALAAALAGEGLNPLPIFVTSLKEPAAAAVVADLLARTGADVVLNATAFAVSTLDAAHGAGSLAPAPFAAGPFTGADCPVLQVVFASTSEAVWREGTAGLPARDLAMNVALPEVDGRILTRAVSFKAEAQRHAPTQCALNVHQPELGRVAFTAKLAAAWVRLRRTPVGERRIGFVLANYPNRDGRLANGVGLDTPAGVVTALEALGAAGYDCRGVPEDAAGLMRALAEGVTNEVEALGARVVRETYGLDAYARFFARLPEGARQAVEARWGLAANDVHVAEGRFRLPATRWGNVVVAVQPARGYHLDPLASCHDPDLVPPHAYFAFYAWLREAFDAHALIHFGKHGNLEWLPGKALALSESCYPEAALGAMPNLYPFIVNDPGEGTQAKRRTAAVIIDHLTPPLARADSYGPLAELERLADEYAEAVSLDPPRAAALRDSILEIGAITGITADCGIKADTDPEAALTRLDRHLCEWKETQIRDGLHVFGRAPEGGLRAASLVALARVPRADGAGANASLIRALAGDLDLGEGFDPLDGDFASAWSGPRPQALAGPDPWRHVGDTVERLEGLALRLVAGERACEPGWSRARAVLDWVLGPLARALDASGPGEIAGLLTGLDGRFVPPGPSGAPSRGRPEVLPTGRNFYSVDTRAVPTPAAWRIGWASAGLVVERYLQDHGDWPRRLALSAWGTANMRTGGDDIAQALALMGVRPVWEVASGRVNGFEILSAGPGGVLDRPRVDVTLRVSGFFRDAFPAQIELVDRAARAVAALDEAEDVNPLAAAVRCDAARLRAEGLDAIEAERRAGYRVFGSMPGAYGAGLQALIDQRAWGGTGDLARAYLAWGGFAYGGGAAGAAVPEAFAQRLSAVELIVHNQDNREHDLLDSDDYYQFEGGLAASVRALSGRTPEIFHNDHSRPEALRVRTLGEEIARVVRARVVNPKWIEGVMRHGYKGAFELAATVDYLFAFSATTGAVANHHFDAVFEAYIQDDRVRAFVAEANPAALREMADRLLEALDRGLWRPRTNAAHGVLGELSGRTLGVSE